VADLDVERIAAAALAVADERGARGFTMRAVAEALGVSPMSLYHHVADKAALAALVVDAAMSERPLPAPTGDWREDMWQLARWTREMTLAHPVVGHLRNQHKVWTQSMLGVSERWVSLWQQTGLPLELAVRAAVTSSLAVLGAVDEEARLAHMDVPDDSLLNWMPNARLLLTTRHNPAANFELLVRSVIDGLHARLAEEDARAARAPKRARR